MHRLSLVVLVFFLSSVSFAEEIPVYDIMRHLTDHSGTLAEEEIAAIETRLVSFERETSNQFAILLIPSVGETWTIEEYSLKVAEQWAGGSADKDNGLLLVVAKNDRKMRFEVGHGLEGVLPDIICGRIIRNEMAPRFREEDFAGGLHAAVTSVILASRGEYEGDGTIVGEGGGDGEADPRLIGFLILSFIALVLSGAFCSAHRVLGGVALAAGMFFITWFLYGNFPLAVVLAIVGFFIGLFSREIVEVGAEIASESSYGTGGGGGGSGWGGGGGSFGGGGATGGW